LQRKNENEIVSKVAFGKVIKELDKLDKNEMLQLYEAENFL